MKLNERCKQPKSKEGKDQKGTRQVDEPNCSPL